MPEILQMPVFSLLMTLTIFTIVSGQSPVPDDVIVEKLADGFQFLEGPLWLDDIGIIFSDIPADKIYQWTPEEGVGVYIEPSGNSNGLALDLMGRLLAAQTGHRRVARFEADGSWTPLAESYDGKKLNSPNDIAVRSDGSIFFTDPPFNIPKGEIQELPFSGIFRITPSGGLQLIDDDLSRPNGICFSPDESKLYVNDSIERIIYVWDVVADSIFTNKRKFASISPPGYIDGMKVDTEGNLYCAGPIGVWIFSPDGTLIDTIEVPGQTTNINWGDANRKSLYVTSGDGIYRIQLNI
jgi:sugar lactone lactonase YvrE